VELIAVDTMTLSRTKLEDDPTESGVAAKTWLRARRDPTTD